MQKISDITISGAHADANETSPFLSQEYWEQLYARENPWSYDRNDFEGWRFEQTLSLLPEGPIAKALEVACAEGHLTSRLAPRVKQLTAVDISATAIKRAQVHCAGHGNVEFRVLNVGTDTLPTNLDLILCSDVLYYLPLEVLRKAAPKIASSIRPHGHLLLAHSNVISDDPERTGFDWDQHPFGAKTIGKIFRALDELTLVKELRTPLFTVSLFRRIAAGGKKIAKAELLELQLPFDLELPIEVERQIIWNGAVTTRTEVSKREVASEIPILMYHSVADDGPPELARWRVSPRTFREHLQYLRRHGFYSITLEEWVASIAEQRPLPGRPVIITFDDGFKDFYDNAWPALQRADFSAVMFVVADRVGKANEWDAQLISKPVPLMSWNELRTIASAGITIGSHTATHKNLNTLSAEQVFLEGRQARKVLREHLGSDIDAIAFPFGEGDAAVRSALARCGYTIGLTAWGGHSTLKDDPMNLPRIEIYGDDDVDKFAARLTRQDDGRGAAALEAQATRFDIEEVRAARASGTPIHPGYAEAMASRLDALVGEFVKLQNELLNTVKSPLTLQKKLTMLFAQPVTGGTTRAVAPDSEISPGISLSFDPAAQASLWVEPKVDHTKSPDTYLNTVELIFTGTSEWLAIAIDLEWSDISLAERFQLSFYAQPSRTTVCHAALRLPRHAGPPLEPAFATFELHPEDMNANVSGDLQLPDFIELDTTDKPTLILYFDTDSDLHLVIHYMNIYFA